MSQTVDTNVLVYATDTASPFHRRAVDLITHLVSGPAIVHLLWPTLLGYLRLVTHPRIVERPLTSAEAITNVGNLVRPAHVRCPGESTGFWQAYQRVAKEVRPAGKLVPDAHIVALMVEHGIATIWTHDRDFRKFSDIRVLDPFDDRYETGFRT